MKITINLNERDADRLKNAAEKMGFRDLDEFALGCVQARLRHIEFMAKVGFPVANQQEREDG